MFSQQYLTESPAPLRRPSKISQFSQLNSGASLQKPISKQKPLRSLHEQQPKQLKQDQSDLVEAVKQLALIVENASSVLGEGSMLAQFEQLQEKELWSLLHQLLLVRYEKRQFEPKQVYKVVMDWLRDGSYLADQQLPESLNEAIFFLMSQNRLDDARTLCRERGEFLRAVTLNPKDNQMYRQAVLALSQTAVDLYEKAYYEALSMSSVENQLQVCKSWKQFLWAFVNAAPQEQDVHLTMERVKQHDIELKKHTLYYAVIAGELSNTFTLPLDFYKLQFVTHWLLAEWELFGKSQDKGAAQMLQQYIERIVELRCEPWIPIMYSSKLGYIEQVHSAEAILLQYSGNIDVIRLFLEYGFDVDAVLESFLKRCLTTRTFAQVDCKLIVDAIRLYIAAQSRNAFYWIARTLRTLLLADQIDAAAQVHGLMQQLQLQCEDSQVLRELACQTALIRGLQERSAPILLEVLFPLEGDLLLWMEFDDGDVQSQYDADDPRALQLGQLRQKFIPRAVEIFIEVCQPSELLEFMPKLADEDLGLYKYLSQDQLKWVIGKVAAAHVAVLSMQEAEDVSMAEVAS